MDSNSTSQEAHDDVLRMSANAHSIPSDQPYDGGWNYETERATPSDPRLVTTGTAIPSRNYTDQPYIVGTQDGAWLCVLTTGSAEEGQRGQHILATRSEDRGQTWSAPVEIEPPSGPEASWAVALSIPSGRIFVFYVYNADNIRDLPADSPPFASGLTQRMDSHGHYVYRWSDDHGRSWSKQRVVIPVREFEIDRTNTTQGKVRLFWNVGRPIISRGEVIVPLHKVGGFGQGWFSVSQGAFVKSKNLLLSPAPEKATWETLPEGDTGLTTPTNGGPIAEEQCILEMSDGSLFCVYRCIDGHPVESYSRTQGRTWEPPSYLTYADGRKVKHPRAACFAWKLANGTFVLWFHHHGGRSLAQNPQVRDRAYEDRNPVWISRGTEVKTPEGLKLKWENPEVALYDDDPNVRISYPDLREEGSTIYLAATQKAIARVHALSQPLARALRGGSAGFNAATLRTEAIEIDPSTTTHLPQLPKFLARTPVIPNGTVYRRKGFALEAFFSTPRSDSTTPLLEAWNPIYGGISLHLIGPQDRIILRAKLSDGRTEWAWDSDPLIMRGPGMHHVIVNVDAGPRILTFFIDGAMSDGGDERQFGWGRFSPYFRGLPVGVPIVTDAHLLKSARFYPRSLLAAEVGALSQSPSIL